MCENPPDASDSVDPRVHIELERLNSATDDINKLELALDEARSQFRQLLCDSTARVDLLRAKLGLCVERAKPYYEARFTSNEALKHTQIAAMKYERANSAHSAAREMVYLAEQGLGGRTLDPAWQEMLNHATQRVNDAEMDRAAAGTEHRIACVRHEAASNKVHSLQKELKRAITKSSLSIRRNLMNLSSLLSQHELLLLPFYEMKAHFNYLLEQQKAKVQHYESQVSSAKLTYAEALRNLEQISDEIHQTRRKASLLPSIPFTQKQRSLDSNESFLDDADEFVDEYKSLPHSLAAKSSPTVPQIQPIDGYKNINYDKDEAFSVVQMQNGFETSEWTEINLMDSSPEDDKGNTVARGRSVKQETLPKMEDLGAIKNRMKLDTNISSWISRSSAKNDENCFNTGRRQSLDNLLGPTGEKVKEMFSQGMMMLNISSLTERRNSEPRIGEEKSRMGGAKKIPSPLEKTMTYLATEEDNSDTESLSSVDMLNEEQINSLMLDKEIGAVCEQVLGTPIAEVVALPVCASLSSQK